MRISSSLLLLSLTILCLGTANAYLWHTRNPAVAALARIASFPRIDSSARAMGFRDPFEDIFDELDADDSHHPQPFSDLGLFAQFDPLQTVRRMQEQHHKLEQRHRKFLDELEARLRLTDSLPPLHTESSMPAAPSAATTSRAGGITEVTSNTDSEHTTPQAASAAESAESSQSANQVSSSSAASSDSLLSQVLRAPKIQVSEKEDSFSLSAEIPGVRKEDLKIEVKEDDFGNRLLSISGERKQEESSSDKERGTSSSRRVYGQFSRTLSLPRDAKTDQITAGYENGVLKISVPREQPKIVTKSIQIQ